MFKIKTQYNIFTLLIVLILALIISVAILRPSWQIGGDGFGYYSYARSLIFDGNFDLHNEFSLFDELYNHNTTVGWQTDTGKTGNPFAIGSAILWSPFILLAKFISTIWHFEDPYAISGYNLPFQIAIALGTWFYFLFGIALIFKTLKKLVDKKYVWWGALIATAISPIPFYLIYEPSMSHGLTVFSLALLFYYSIKLYKSPKINYKYLTFSALALGLVFLVRWQDVLFGVIPIGIVVYKLWLLKNWHKYLLSASIFISFFFLIALPQLLMWKHLYGAWIAVPQGASFFDLTHPHIWQFLFSSYHGMFIIHPLLILAIIGLFYALKKYKYLVILLILALCLQTYINSGLSDWYGGGSFGARRMAGSLFVFILGFAFLFKYLNQKKYIKIVIIGLVFTGLVLNGLLMIAYARGIIPLNAPTSYTDIYLAPIKVLSDL
ncbi:hypothetical protein HOD19_03740 [bacterium]|jgi:hypothetical protein|nr:hypothetical protein [bacterium]MBT4648925.1 hypothetical protein [bacterium]